MPLIARGYLIGAAGLLVGFGGGALWAVGSAVLGLLVALRTRSVIAAALSALLLASAVLARTIGRDDAECARTFAARGRAIVRLDEDLAPRRAARGSAVGHGCVVAVRVSVDEGHFDAGTLVDVRGVVRGRGDAVVFANASAVVVAPAAVLARWRSRAGRSLDTLYGPQAPLARALLIADERDIAPEVRRDFADAGIIHMLSVSGLHVAILAEAVALTLLLAGAGVRRAEDVAVGVTVAFVLFVGAPPAAVRAGAMYGSVILSRRLQRPTSPWALLSLGAILPLANPRVVLDVGYQLSVVGMAGLIASGSLARRIPFPRRPPWAARLGRELLATIIASMVTAPIVAWHFGRLSLAAPFTNLAVAPLFALAQPALFLSLVVAPVHPIAQFVADGTGILLAGITRVAAVGASLPGAALEVMPATTTALLLAAGAGATIMACVMRQWVRPALAGLAAVGAALWWPIVAPGGDRLELHMIDVGQGDAIALRTPAGRWIVVDAGDAWRGGDAGARTVAPYLTRRGGDVAALILTHPHNDHIGGAASLLRLVRVGAMYDGGLVYPTTAYDTLLASARMRRVPWRLARTGDTLSVDGVRLRVLGPDSITVAEARDANESSVVVLAEYRGVRLLLTGDAERHEEERMVAAFGPDLHADVLKVGHHGSSTSSSDGFLDAVHPRLALISVGAGNHYGHPSADVLGTFAHRRVQTLRTDEDGSVVVSIDGRTLRIQTDDGSWTVPLAPTRP